MSRTKTITGALVVLSIIAPLGLALQGGGGALDPNAGALLDAELPGPSDELDAGIRINAPPPVGEDDHNDTLALPDDLPTSICIEGAGCLDTPLVVDEHGDTMFGDLTMEADVVVTGANAVRFAGGALSGNPQLRYGANAVCLAAN